ncbi:helix-turn-helix domain-containing protein [Oceanobacillus kapialis]|uniref:Helix-turn-helix domain-containing protein n=1 Tax=Oceanobacillus kapialis TaxID=481353 RepID=A0ABW5PW98_9BACI
MKLLDNISIKFEDILIGISEKSNHTTQESILEKYEQAQFGLKVGRYKGQKINEWAALGYDKYLYAVQQNEILQKSALNFLKPLIKHDEKFNSELILTLSVYLDSFFSLKKSAEALFIHKNTVKYRINKVKELYKDISLEDPESYLLFSLSLKLYRILEKNK